MEQSERSISIVLDFLKPLLDRGVKFEFQQTGLVITPMELLTPKEGALLEMIAPDMLALRPLLHLIIEKYEPGASIASQGEGEYEILNIEGVE
jgi:hypothetical protein